METKIEQESGNQKAGDAPNETFQRDETGGENKESEKQEHKEIPVTGKTKANKKKLVEELETLLRSIPDSPKFIGKMHKFRKGLMDKLFNTGEYGKLKSMRARVNKFAERDPDLNVKKKDMMEHFKSWIELDEKLARALKRHKHIADLHALNAIHIYSKSKIYKKMENKYPLLKKALKDMALALHNEGVNIFNTLWFIEMYFDYLGLIKQKTLLQLKAPAMRDDKQVRQLFITLQQKVIDLEVLLTIKERLDGLNMLNRKLRNSAYSTDGFKMAEIRRAASAIKNGEEQAEVGEGKVSNFTIAVIVIISLIFARIPMLSALVKDISSNISDGSRELRLQKRMIVTTTLLNHYDLAVAENNETKKREFAEKVYKYCHKSISHYWQNSDLIKPYEVDAFLKLGWITVESKDLFDTSSYRKKLEQSINFLEIVMNHPKQTQETMDQAKQLLFTLTSFETEYH